MKGKKHQGKKGWIGNADLLGDAGVAGDLFLPSIEGMIVINVVDIPLIQPTQLVRVLLQVLLKVEKEISLFFFLIKEVSADLKKEL